MVCGATEEESYKGIGFCGGCWDRFKALMMGVDWQADPAFLVEYLKKGELKK